jgi:chromosome segregation ATPase
MAEGFDIRGTEAFGEVVERTSRQIDYLSSALGKNKERLEELKIELDAGRILSQEYAAQSDKLIKRQQKLRGTLDSVKKGQRGLTSAATDVAKSFPKSIKNYTEYEASLKRINDTFNTHMRNLKNSMNLPQDKYDKMLAEAQRFKEELAKVADGPIKLVLESESKDLDVARKASRELVGSAGSDVVNIASGVSDVTCIKSETLSGSARFPTCSLSVSAFSTFAFASRRERVLTVPPIT